MPQWVYNILLPVFLAFAIPTVNSIADSGAKEQRLMQVEEGIGLLLKNSEGSRNERLEILQRQARTEEKVAGLQVSVDRIATKMLEK